MNVSDRKASIPNPSVVAKTQLKVSPPNDCLHPLCCISFSAGKYGLAVAYIFVRRFSNNFPTDHDELKLKITLKMLTSESRQFIKINLEGHVDLDASKMHDSLLVLPKQTRAL